MTQSELDESTRQQGRLMAALLWTWLPLAKVAHGLPKEEAEAALITLQCRGMVEADGQGRYRKRAVQA